MFVSGVLEGMMYIHTKFINLFFRNSTMSGTHELPIFKGQYPEGMLEDLTNHPVNEVFTKWKWDRGSRLVS